MMIIVRKTHNLLLLFTLIFIVFIVVYPIKQNVGTLLSVVSFLFGIVIVFVINNRNDRLNGVNTLLKAENSYNLLIYKLSRRLPEENRDKIAKMLDEYIQSTIDYRLEDFEQTDSYFDKLYDYIVGLKVSDQGDRVYYKELIRTLNKSMSNRTQIASVVTDRLSAYEWTNIGGLTAAFIYLLYAASNHSISNIIILTLVAASSVLLVLILRDFNNLKWKKRDWTWDQLFQLYTRMGMKPYISSQILEIREYDVKAGSNIRIASYPKGYEALPDKVVVEVENYDPAKDYS